jgi:uncharacterized membrane protein AbrB (regulator of aidB expression)
MGILRGLKLPSVYAVGSLSLAALAGFGAQFAHVPLAWILGPLLATAIAAIAAPRSLRPSQAAASARSSWEPASVSTSRHLFCS